MFVLSCFLLVLNRISKYSTGVWFCPDFPFYILVTEDEKLMREVAQLLDASEAFCSAVSSFPLKLHIWRFNAA